MQHLELWRKTRSAEFVGAGADGRRKSARRAWIVCMRAAPQASFRPARTGAQAVWACCCPFCNPLLGVGGRHAFNQRAAASSSSSRGLQEGQQQQVAGRMRAGRGAGEGVGGQGGRGGGWGGVQVLTVLLGVCVLWARGLDASAGAPGMGAVGGGTGRWGRGARRRGGGGGGACPPTPRLPHLPLVVTLNLKKMMSPSCTVYPLPS